MVKVTDVCIDTSPDSFLESKDGFVNWLLQCDRSVQMTSSIALSFSSFLGLGYESGTFPALLTDSIVKRLRSSKLGCPPNDCADSTSFATFRVLLLVPGSPSCNAIKSDLSPWRCYRLFALTWAVRCLPL